MSQTALGVMLKRLFVRPQPAEQPPDPPEAPGVATPVTHAGPPLVMLVPGVAGVSIYQLRSFDDAHAAAAFIESCNPYRVYKEGIIAFWGMHEQPPRGLDSECAVLVRTEPNSDLVHAYAFADLDTANAYVRYRIEETGEVPESFVVQWAASIRINANPTGEVRLEPSTPPIVARPMTPATEPASPLPAFVDPEPEESAMPSVAGGSDDPSVSMEVVADAKTMPVPPSPPRDVMPAAARGPAAKAAMATRWSRKTPRKAPARVKAYVLALGLMGFTTKDIEGELRAMFPGDRVPTRATIGRWLKRAGISRSNLKKWEAMSDHAMRVLETRLAELDAAPLSEVARVASVLEGMRRK